MRKVNAFGAVHEPLKDPPVPTGCVPVPDRTACTGVVSAVPGCTNSVLALAVRSASPDILVSLRVTSPRHLRSLLPLKLKNATGTAGWVPPKVEPQGPVAPAVQRQCVLLGAGDVMALCVWHLQS